jgi:hypothetical protein
LPVSRACAPWRSIADWYGWEHDSFSGIDRRDDRDVSSEHDRRRGR